jgi:two-component system chemotaxis response regulator CheY
MNNKKVLIVDDSMVMRSMIGNILRDEEYEVAGEAENGNEAFEQYKLLKPYLVTLDIVMPNEQGLDALKKIIQYDPNARIIIVSGLHQKTLVMQAIDSGAKDFVIKPFNKEDLMKAVRRCT